MTEPKTPPAPRRRELRRGGGRRRLSVRIVTQAVVLGVLAGGTAAFAVSDVRAGNGSFSIAGGTLDLRATLVAHPSRTEGERADLGGLATVHVDDGELDVALAALDEPTVREVLRSAGVVLGPHDQVEPGLDENATGSVTVTRVTTEARSETVEQPFETVRQDDGALEKGSEVVAREGRTGLQVVAYEAHLVDGVEVDRTVLASRVVREPVDALVRVGTFEPPPPGATVSPGTARELGREMVLARGWDESQWQCLDSLWQKESGWRTTAENRSSGAYGIPQSLPGSKMASVADDWRTNPATQITWGLGYIGNRYGTPCGAWAHSQARNWY